MTYQNIKEKTCRDCGKKEMIKYLKLADYWLCKKCYMLEEYRTREKKFKALPLGKKKVLVRKVAKEYLSSDDDAWAKEILEKRKEERLKKALVKELEKKINKEVNGVFYATIDEEK
jgi:hypothetical protein